MWVDSRTGSGFDEKSCQWYVWGGKAENCFVNVVRIPYHTYFTYQFTKNSVIYLFFWTVGIIQLLYMGELHSTVLHVLRNNIFFSINFIRKERQFISLSNIASVIFFTTEHILPATRHPQVWQRAWRVCGPSAILIICQSSSCTDSVWWTGHCGWQVCVGVILGGKGFWLPSLISWSREDNIMIVSHSS